MTLLLRRRLERMPKEKLCEMFNNALKLSQLSSEELRHFNKNDLIRLYENANEIHREVCAITISSNIESEEK